MKHILTALLSLSFIQGQAWVTLPPPPLATYWVSDQGTGSGTSRNDPMSLATAATTYVPGDLYWMFGGDYGTEQTFLRKGTAANPVVFRCLPGHRCIIDEISIANTSNEADYLYFWNWELVFTTEAALDADSVLFIGSNAAGTDGIYLINNLIHDNNASGYGGWNRGTDHVYYGNICYDLATNTSNTPHCMYTQNNFDTYGMKYVVSNMFVDQGDQTLGGDHYNFHGFGTGDATSGYHLENNIFANGRNVLGTQATELIAARNTLKENWIYGNQFQLHIAAINQFDVNNNYFGNSGINSAAVWCQDTGVGGPAKPAEINFSNNIIASSAAVNAFLMDCACFIDGTFTSGRNPPLECGLDAGTTWDNNTYSRQGTNVTVNYGYSPDEPIGKLGAIDQSGGWLDDTGYDALSTINHNTTAADAVFVDPNEYEEMKRCHVAIFNWDLSANQDVNLATCISVGTRYKVWHVNNAASRAHVAPVLAGTYTTDPVSFPTNSQEFAAYLVVKDYNFGGGSVANKRSRGRR